MPEVGGTVTLAFATPVTELFPCDVAPATSSRLPLVAKVGVPMVTGTVWDAPGPRDTDLTGIVAIWAAGPPNETSNVSANEPVFVTTIWNDPPGPVLDGVNCTLTPLATTLRV